MKTLFLAFFIFGFCTPCEAAARRPADCIATDTALINVAEIKYSDMTCPQWNKIFKIIPSYSLRYLFGHREIIQAQPGIYNERPVVGVVIDKQIAEELDIEVNIGTIIDNIEVTDVGNVPIVVTAVISNTTSKDL